MPDTGPCPAASACNYCRGYGHYDGCPYCGETPSEAVARRIRHCEHRERARRRARLNRARNRRRGLLIAAACGAAAGLIIAARPPAAAAADWQPASARDQRTATQVAAWLTRQGFPVKPDPMWVTDSIPNDWYPGEGYVAATATARGPLLIRAVTTGPDAKWTVSMTLIHEYLHSLRDPAQYAALTAAERHVEEGAVTAVTEDLTPRFWCAVWRECGPSTVMVFGESSGLYAAWAAMVRGVSGRAVSGRWTSPQARKWRYELVKADRAQRAAMWTAVTR